MWRTRPWFVYSIYEPLYDYHYLKRPYELQPNTAVAMPLVSYRDAAGRELPADAAPSAIAETVYEIRLKPGILYQPHPAFALDAAGQPLYLGLDDAAIGQRTQLGDFEHSGTRELVAADYAYQIKRLVRPGLESPGIAIFEQIVGLEELSQQLEAALQAGQIDTERWIDLRDFALEGVETPDAYTLRIRIRGKYPQFLYWLATSFVVPVPWEVERFYAQPGMAKREFTLDMWPVGTGPYMLTQNRPLRELRLERNPNFRLETYPCEGEAGDAASGLLDDCGKPLPLADGYRFSYEREAPPFWNKFLQGYYDFYSSARFAGFASFDTALQVQGDSLSLSPQMIEQGIGLRTEIEPSVEYFFVNMLGPGTRQRCGHTPRPANARASCAMRLRSRSISRSTWRSSRTGWACRCRGRCRRVLPATGRARPASIPTVTPGSRAMRSAAASRRRARCWPRPATRTGVMRKPANRY